MSGAGLEVVDLSVSYGLSQALFGVSISIEAGSVVAVLGRNGAGKTTFGRTVSGLVRNGQGHVIFDGIDITKSSPHRIRRAGLTYIPEGRGIFPGLSVIDNLRMATRQAGSRHDRQEGVNRAMELFPVLQSRTAQRAGTLSGGEQQMLALARALAIKPRLIIADEMSLGLSPLMVDRVFDRLEQVRDEGITLVLIEQYIHRALAFADKCVILKRGTVGWSGPAGEAGAEVLEQYLGKADAMAVAAD